MASPTRGHHLWRLRPLPPDHPGTAKRVGAATRWPGRTVTRWRVRKWPSRSLERCTVAALADICMLLIAALAIIRSSLSVTFSGFWRDLVFVWGLHHHDKKLTQYLRPTCGARSPDRYELANVDPLELGGLRKVLLHVGTAVVEPTDGHTYDPTDGATTQYLEVPVCASAAVPEKANVVANTIVVSFMVVCFLCRLDRCRIQPLERPWIMVRFYAFDDARSIQHQTLSSSLRHPMSRLLLAPRRCSR